jgi:hypothetical protein
MKTKEVTPLSMKWVWVLFLLPGCACGPQTSSAIFNPHLQVATCPADRPAATAESTLLKGEQPWY